MKLEGHNGSVPALAPHYTLEAMGVGKLFYCHTGRNAWWTIWITRYSEGCMHASIEGAKAFAETKRVQGTVFYIAELPALIFHGHGQCLAVTQINTTDPLAGYSATAVRAGGASGTKKLVGAHDNYFVSGASFEGISLSFNYDSRFWTVTAPPTNSVVQLVGKGELNAFQILVDEPLRKYQSYSNGPRYLMGWRVLESKIQAKFTLNLYETIDKGLAWWPRKI